MPRFNLRQLAAATRADIGAEFSKRLQTQIVMLQSACVAAPPALAPALERVNRGWQAAAQGGTSEADAVAIAEEGARAAVDSVRVLPGRLEEPAQRVLRSTFSALVGHRALVQAAEMARADEVLLQPGSELPGLLDDVVEDSRAFCREKFGDSPDVTVMRVTATGAADSASAATSDTVLLAPFLVFSLTELLKNAMGAHVRAVGADKLDRLRPIELRHGMRNGVAFIGVTDFGGGLAGGAADATRASQFLHSTNPEREATYTYSRNFGAGPFEGLGMGLPLAALHARYLGGALHVHSVAATSRDRPAGVHAGFTFSVTGHRPEPDDDAWVE